ncbi:polyprenyl synthetase family protein [Haematospirillum jordaniae]|nr:polyprenyl synthetase family protein [Haematospirillum jordaniae]NKD76630.1 polyprenyl synthetase family protein [Haematospirillum sp. H1815]NKD56723.1 polyprenyl synthetase family protein [Haematospirillum jordaniae]NKD59121.1 polyprenyl synthetase family protein [Haematospirillum jordaniae]NKD67836.1 polyprenyl synthetase family protein [Haematospirillum jordaniae]
MPGMSLALQAALKEKTAAVETMLARLIPEIPEAEGRVFEAMRYSTLAGGKRLRPFLVLATADMFNVSETAALRTASAVEMVHCYSLVHDDLPAMDDDSMRRGKPACHRQFDEATAILAGDALLTRAFEVLAAPSTHADPAVRCTLVSELAKAAGPHGMVGGQMVDLLAERKGRDHLGLDVSAITRMHQMKTGRIIGFSCMAGAILGKAPPQIRHALQAYAHDLGLAFQIVDDLLDVEGDPARMGKTQGKDAAAGKATFVTLLGLERAKEQARALGEQAISHLKVFDEEASLLRDVVGYVLERQS